MAEVALDGVTKRFGTVDRGRRDLDLTIADGEFVVLLGPTGAGKTTTLRLVAGLETPDAGRICIGGRDVTRARAGGARRRLRVPAILALSAPHRLRQPRLPAALAGARACPRPRSSSASRRSRELLRIDGQAAEPRDAAFRRRDAARRDRPRAGAPAGDLPDGRAALLARRQAARRAAPRAEAHPAGARRDHPLRHARPDRGHDDGQPHRRASTRPAGAGRHAARDLRATRATSMSRPGSASPAINLLPARAASRHGGCPAGAKTIGARTEHLRIAQGRERRGDRQGRLDRASRRPEPPARQRRRPQARHAGRSASGARASATRFRWRSCDPLYFDAAGNRVGSAMREASCHEIDATQTLHAS